MKRTIALCVLLASIALVALAQETNPVTTVVREMLPHQQKNIIAAVEEMPADKFNFKPTPEQMTFGHLALHIIESNNSLCRTIGNMPPPPAKEAKETDSKNLLLAAMTRSFEFCDAALAKMDDSKLGETVELFGGHEGSRAAAMIFLTNGWADHYSTAAQYLRLNGLLPPTAQPKK